MYFYIFNKYYTIEFFLINFKMILDYFKGILGILVLYLSGLFMIIYQF